MASITDRINTAVVVGSTRPGRRAPAIAEWVSADANPRLKMQIVDLASLDLPMLNEPTPAAFGQYELSTTRRFAELIAGFDAFVLVTPEYNHSTSGALKNALDHLHAEWRDKPVAFVGYGLDGGTRAVEHLRTICAELGMPGVGPQVAFDLRDDVTDDGAIAPRERTLRARGRMLDTLARWSTALRSLPPATVMSADASEDSRPTVDQPAARSSAQQALDGFVAAIQAGLDGSDAELYDAQFAADVLWGSPYGETLAGFGHLSDAHRWLMSNRVGADSHYEVVQMLAPAPGIAIAHVRRRSLAADDGTFSEMALYVLVQQAGRWWLAAGQNTPIVDPAVR